MGSAVEVGAPRRSADSLRDRSRRRSGLLPRHLHRGDHPDLQRLRPGWPDRPAPGEAATHRAGRGRQHDAGPEPRPLGDRRPRTRHQPRARDAEPRAARHRLGPREGRDDRVGPAGADVRARARRRADAQVRRGHQRPDGRDDRQRLPDPVLHADPDEPLDEHAMAAPRPAARATRATRVHGHRLLRHHTAVHGQLALRPHRAPWRRITRHSLDVQPFLRARICDRYSQDVRTVSTA